MENRRVGRSAVAFWAAVLAVICGSFSAREGRAAQAAEDLFKEARQLRARYVADIEQLATWCDENGLDTPAQKTRGVLTRFDPYKLYMPMLPVKIGSAKLVEGVGGGKAAEAIEWSGRFLKLRRDYATAVFDLAKRAIRRRQQSLAYMAVLAAIREDPDNEGARRVFGYQKFHGEWRTGYETRKLRSGMLWNDKFGWLSEAYAARYEKGERYSGGRWISAEADAQARDDIRNGWDIETEHYVIRTNRSIEAAVTLAVKLENLHSLWQQLFIRYYASESYIDSLFNARTQSRKTDPPQYHVVLFRDQEDYVKTLKPIMANIAISQGLYISQNQRAYFFAGSEDTERVMYHEATHQLFQQSRRVPDDVGQKANFWIVEGIAMFMESLHQEDGYHVLGGLNDDRLRAARYHCFTEKYYVPFGPLSAMGINKLQSDPKIAKLYSQMAAMTHFLVFYEGGRYRDALVSYISAVYSGRDDPNLLAQLTGTSYVELDRQYQEFLKVGAAE